MSAQLGAGGARLGVTFDVVCAKCKERRRTLEVGAVIDEIA